MMKNRKSVLIVFAAGFLLACCSPAFGVTREEVLKDYERVIVKSNQMNVYGYDLREISLKLKQMSDILLANRLELAEKLLGEIEKDLKAIEARGPEYLHREKRLAWLEIYGDLIKQLAIFAVLSFLLLRFRFVKNSILAGVPDWSARWKLFATFAIISAFAVSVGFIRSDRASWPFVDLQLLWISIGALTGGVWVGLFLGALGSLSRLLIVEQIGIYFALPLVIGIAAGFFHRFRLKGLARVRSMVFIGAGIGLIHALFLYVPIFPFLRFASFVIAVLFLTGVDTAALFSFFMIARLIYVDDQRKETERELFRARLSFLQAQINPHFLFNTLNTIAAVCGEENAQRARDLVIQLSTIFRRLTKHEGDFVSLKDEFEYIDAYLNIEKARFGDRLQIEKDIRLSTDGLSVSVPILVLQPIVENAVKHGLSQKADGGVLQIRAEESETAVSVEIQDNGVGMDAQTQANLLSEKKPVSAPDAGHAGIGMSNIAERMNKLFGKRFQIEIKSRLNAGTTIRIKIPKP